jgi:hypothetical protein
MIISQEQKELKAARELMLKSELKRVRLRRCHVELQGEESNLRVPFGLAESHNAAATLVGVDNTLRIEVAFSFQAFDASEGKVSLFSIQCSFDLDYELESGYHPGHEAIDAFKDGNAVFNCWPYARECVQSLAGRMALRPPPLPLLRIVPKPKLSGKASAPKPELEASITPATKE